MTTTTAVSLLEINEFRTEKKKTLSQFSEFTFSVIYFILNFFPVFLFARPVWTGPTMLCMHNNNSQPATTLGKCCCFFFFLFSTFIHSSRLYNSSTVCEKRTKQRGRIFHEDFSFLLKCLISLKCR